MGIPIFYLILFFGWHLWIQTSSALSWFLSLRQYNVLLASKFSIWFNIPLPTLLPKFEGFVEGPIICYICLVGSWHIYGLLQQAFDHFHLFASYKVHRRDTLSYFDMMPTVLVNQVHLLLSMLCVWKFNGFDFTLPMPSTSQLILTTFRDYVVYEICFYFGHRALHSKLLYPFHHKHHLTKASVGVSGMYQGHLDYFLTTTFALAVGPILFGTHFTCGWIQSVVGGLNSIHSHGAYEFPFFATTDAHDLHHLNYKCNYGTGPLDYLLGTNDESEMPGTKSKPSPSSYSSSSS